VEVLEGDHVVVLEDLGGGDVACDDLAEDAVLGHAPRSGARRGTSRAASRSRAAPRRPASSKGRATSCAPTGSPSAVKPALRLSAGRAARFTPTVKMSERYILSGSSVRSWGRNAGVGAVGRRRRSARSKARA